MNITASGNMLKLTFAYNAATVAQVKAVTGATWDKADKAWYLPIAALPTLQDLFGHVAQFDYAALVAYDEARGRAARELFRMLRRSGASFRVTEDDIVLCEGECVSPLVADIVRERSVYMRPCVEKWQAEGVSGRFNATSDVETQKKPSEGVTGVLPTAQDELMAKAIAGAVKAEERKKQYRREWWQRSDMQQGELR